VYIGSTISSFDTRFRIHKKAISEGRHDNDQLNILWEKYHTIDCQILEATEDKDKVRELEQYYLNTYRKTHNICNEQEPELEGSHLSAAVKKKISDGCKKTKRKSKSKMDWRDSSPNPERDEYHRRMLELRKA
jgi:hypothetical protein